MKKKVQQERAATVQRYLAGEDPESICASLGRSRRWLYKWLARHIPDDSAWYEDLSRRPLVNPHRTPAEIEKIVEMVRWRLYNNDLFCGSQAILWEMEDMNIQPFPSISTVDRILRLRELTYRRTGRYTPKGKKYPRSRRSCLIKPIRLIWSALATLPAQFVSTACMRSILRPTDVV